MSETTKPTLLIATVGGAPQPIVASIKEWSPSFTIFIVSKATRDSVNMDKAGQTPPCGNAHPECKVIRLHDPIPSILSSLMTKEVADFDGRWEFFDITDPQDYASLVREMRALDARVDRWRSSHPNAKVVVDFTGGTKAMSAAMALISSRWENALISYVGGKEREKGGVGVTVNGKEEILYSQNPWEALGYLVEEQAKTLFNNGYFAAAKQILGPARNAAVEPRKSEISAFVHLCEFFDLWDNFQHKKALAKIEQIRKDWNNLPLLDVHKKNLKVWIEKEESTLELLCAADSAEKRRAQVVDLVANADRRIKQNAYDDAVARLYRATEALAQAELYEYGFPDTAKIPFGKLPSSLQQYWGQRKINGYIKLGLHESYTLLAKLDADNKIAKKFIEIGLNDPKTSLLTTRN